MMRKKYIVAYMILMTILMQFVVPTAMAGNEWTEKLDRGFIAVPTDNGMYLGWRLQENEDNIFGTAPKNVSFNIYRNGKKIATETNTTNFIDAEGSVDDVYAVMVSDIGSVSFLGNIIKVCAPEDGTKAYAAKYADSGELEKVQAFETDTDFKTFTTDFDIDKVFVWRNMKPVNTSAYETATVIDDGYITIPLDKPEDETITSPDGTVQGTYSFMPADCSTGDLDGDGEYEIVIKWTSSEHDVGDSVYSGTVRFSAYKLDGTKLWDNDINLGRNVYSSAHTVQFLVYDFNGDGKAEMMCQTSLGSKDATGNYVTKSADYVSNADIYNVTDEENETADYRGNGRITTGKEFLTVFDGETGVAIDTITLPTSREVTAGDNGASYGDNFGNRSNRFLADVAYLDGEKPYAVFQRGYYMKNSTGRTSIAGISFDGEKLSVPYRFDTYPGQIGYYSGAEIYIGQGNHNCTVADVDGDGKDEYITGALCMEIDDNNELKPRWCTFMEHGNALHIGDYDPTNNGLEVLTTHECAGPNTMSGTEIPINYGVSVIDANSGKILFHVDSTSSTNRGLMANIGFGGYYQIRAIDRTYIAIGNGKFEEVGDIGMSKNFRIFWDGDLYDELLDGTEITNWNGNGIETVFDVSEYDCVSVNDSKATPSLQADLLGDWREELVYPTSDGTALKVFTTTAKTDYKMKSLMYDKVYRMGVAAQQTAYNQPPHIGYYISEDMFLNN